jgi:putative acetyltransferase
VQKSFCSCRYTPHLLSYIGRLLYTQTESNTLNIRETTPADLNDIIRVEKAAFKRDKEADLTVALLGDPSAEPRLSLIATIDDLPVGHILFTKGTLTNHPNLAVSFLAPLAVVPDFQSHGIGKSLIKKGLEILAKSGVDLVFVGGHPSYYPKSGFSPASKLGFDPTYPFPVEVVDAWMVRALKPNLIGKVSGRVICCDVLNKPELWKE